MEEKIINTMRMTLTMLLLVVDQEVGFARNLAYPEEISSFYRSLPCLRYMTTFQSGDGPKKAPS